jgi:hypothetical protein
MPSPQAACPQRVQLAQEVPDAVQRKYEARDKHDRVAEAEVDTTLTLQALTEAGTAERVLVAKLAQHRQEHGC